MEEVISIKLLLDPNMSGPFQNLSKQYDRVFSSNTDRNLNGYDFYEIKIQGGLQIRYDQVLELIT